MSEPTFTPAFFRFLRALRKNNDRDWFLANKEAYERDVKEPALRFIAGFEPALRRINRHLVADPRPVGGSMFRIHRDIRFAKDKRPYKTHVGIHFRHEAAKDAYAPGLYLHLEPGDVFAAAGIWRPKGAALSDLRDAIAAQPTSWRRAVGGRAFNSRFELSGESLTRVPRGYDRDHPLERDLRRKSFIAITGFRESEACSADFPERLEEAWRESRPFLRFIAKALDLSF